MMASALMYVEESRYSAYLFRRSFSELNQPKALVSLSHGFLDETDAEWNGQKFQWTFPSGATINFGYLDGEQDKFHYRGSEIMGLYFDELTGILESNFRFLNSRTRRPEGCQIPIRVRSASNPGDRGHAWVRSRYVDPKTRSCVFIPAKLEDNPYLDRESYEESLNVLDPITRAQLRHGDWDVNASAGVFHRADFRLYTQQDGFYRLAREPGQTWTVDRRDCQRFATLDVAATAKQQADYSVLQIWDMTPSFDMVLVHQWRGQVEIPKLIPSVVNLCRQTKTDIIGVESNGIGKAVAQMLRAAGLTVRFLHAVADKVVRSQSLQIRAEAHQVHLPEDRAAYSSDIRDEKGNPRYSGLDDLLSELEGFPAGPHDDMVDSAAYGAQMISRLSGAPRGTNPEPPPASGISLAAAPDSEEAEWLNGS